MGCLPSKKGKRKILNLNEVLISPGLFVKVNTRPFKSVYNLGRRLGNGSYGEVRFCTHITSGAQRAVKIFNKLDLDVNISKVKLLQEIEVLKRLDHPCIIRVFESFLEQDYYYIVMEHCKGGELFKEIIKQKQFDEPTCAVIMKQILSAVAYMHDKNIVHRDLKPENILFEEVTGSLNIKLIDFGTAKTCLPGKLLREAVGSAYYVAPEVLSSAYNHSCDLWSVGVVMYILLAGYPPFEGDSDEELLKKVQSGQYDFNEDSWKCISQYAKDLICKFLCPASQRISALEALQDPWITDHNRKYQPNNTVVKNLLSKITDFQDENKLQGAVRTFIASQMITTNELDDVRKSFMALDANGDGKLSREELSDGYAKLFGGNSEEMVDNIMRIVDVDQSGFVDYSEFVRVTMDKSKLVSEQNLRSAFELFDEDGNGKISAFELREILSGNAQSNEELWQQLINDFDANGDGEIDIEEFKQIIKKHL